MLASYFCASSNKCKTSNLKWMWYFNWLLRYSLSHCMSKTKLFGEASFEKCSNTWCLGKSMAWQRIQGFYFILLKAWEHIQFYWVLRQWKLSLICHFSSFSYESEIMMTQFFLSLYLRGFSPFCLKDFSSLYLISFYSTSFACFILVWSCCKHRRSKGKAQQSVMCTKWYYKSQEPQIVLI